MNYLPWYHKMPPIETLPKEKIDTREAQTAIP